jgi:hypothetical protein
MKLSLEPTTADAEEIDSLQRNSLFNSIKSLLLVSWAFAPSLAVAQGEPGPAPSVGSTGMIVREWLILLGALLAVSITLALVLSSARSRRRLRRHRSSRSQPVFAEPATVRPRRHRRRRKRHDEFPANPTLAETGGLPPIRAEAESDLPAEHQPQ